MSPLRAAILASEDIESEEHFIPEWGQKVTIRGMTGAERDRFEAAHLAAKGTGWVRANLAVLCCRDDAGELIFSPDDAQLLAGKSAAALSRIFDVAARLAGITPTDVDDLEKN